MIYDTKPVTWQKLRPGQKIQAWRQVVDAHTADAVVKSVDSHHVTILVDGQREVSIRSDDTVFEVELTPTELRKREQGRERTVQDWALIISISVLVITGLVITQNANCLWGLLLLLFCL